jgi:hypothetical protein
MGRLKRDQQDQQDVSPQHVIINLCPQNWGCHVSAASHVMLFLKLFLKILGLHLLLLSISFWPRTTRGEK